MHDAPIDQMRRGVLLAGHVEPAVRGWNDLLMDVAVCSTNRPGRNRTCNPRFWSPLLATPASERLLIFNDLALGQRRWRCWTTPALALILALRKTNSG
jgi:hypothetical protein